MTTATQGRLGRLVEVGGVADIPLMEGRSVEIDGRRIAVFNLGTGFAAIDGTCPHRGGPLADGIVAGGCVTCPLHSWRFDLCTGEIVGGSPSGDGCDEHAVRSYEVEVLGDRLLIRIDEPVLIPA